MFAFAAHDDDAPASELGGFLGRVAAAYERTVQERGTIPSIILDEPDKDAQEARLLAELGNPAFVIAHVIVEPPERKEEPSPVAKAYVEDNVRRFESQPPVTPTPTIRVADAALAVGGLDLVILFFGERAAFLALVVHPFVFLTHPTINDTALAVDDPMWLVIAVPHASGRRIKVFSCEGLQYVFAAMKGFV